MADWAARYEEGYVTVTGESITLADQLHTDQPWDSPDAALLHWTGRADLSPPNTETFENGLQQIDDVRHRAEFASLGVAAIWRRVTFQHDKP